jgi:hypothetical protein
MLIFLTFLVPTFIEPCQYKKERIYFFYPGVVPYLLYPLSNMVQDHSPYLYLTQHLQLENSKYLLLKMLYI